MKKEILEKSKMLSRILNKDDLKNVVTKTEFDVIKEIIAELKKQVKISQILS